MGKLFRFLGFFIVGLIVLVAGALGWGYFQQSQYKKTAIPYVTRVLPEMTKWDASNARQFMAPQALEGTSNEEFEALFTWMSRLGQLESYEEPKFLNVTAGATAQLGPHKIVRYQVKSHFENGDGDVTIQLLEKGGHFSILGFHVNSPVLIGLPGKRSPPEGLDEGIDHEIKQYELMVSELNKTPEKFAKEIPEAEKRLAELRAMKASRK